VGAILYKEAVKALERTLNRTLGEYIDRETCRGEVDVLISAG